MNMAKLVLVVLLAFGVVAILSSACSGECVCDDSQATGCGASSAAGGQGGSTATGGGAVGGSGGSGGSGGAAAPQPGTITVTQNDITGHQGKVFLAIATKTVPQEPLGAHCEMIDESPDSITGTLSQIGEHPCDLGSPIIFEPGEYQVWGVILIPGDNGGGGAAGAGGGGGGSPELQACSITGVNVDGNVEVTLPALGDCPAM